MPFRPYLDVLRTPGVPRLLGAAVLGRMPIGMAGLAIVLLVRQTGGSYATAGLVAGSYAISLGLTAPLLGRLIDRVGQTRVLLATAGVSAAAFAALAVAAEAGSRALLPVLAALGGASLPPVAACLRALWSELLGRGAELQAAFSVEAIVQELIFVVGPPLVAILAAVFAPAAAMLGIAILLLAGIGVFAGAPASRAGLAIAPAIACLYLLIDRLAPAGTVTEAFTWVNSAFGTGIAIGNATGGGVVHRAGADAVFLLAAVAVVAAALLARVRRPALAERSDRPSLSGGAVRPRPEPAGD